MTACVSGIGFIVKTSYLQHFRDSQIFGNLSILLQYMLLYLEKLEYGMCKWGHLENIENIIRVGGNEN